MSRRRTRHKRRSNNAYDLMDENIIEFEKSTTDGGSRHVARPSARRTMVPAAGQHDEPGRSQRETLAGVCQPGLGRSGAVSALAESGGAGGQR